jgi:hypothetical protein
MQLTGHATTHEALLHQDCVTSFGMALARRCVRQWRCDTMSHCQEVHATACRIYKAGALTKPVALPADEV